MFGELHGVNNITIICYLPHVKCCTNAQMQKNKINAEGNLLTCAVVLLSRLIYPGSFGCHILIKILCNIFFGNNLPFPINSTNTRQ